MKKLHILVNGGVRTRPTSKATLQLLSNSGFGEQSFEFLQSDDAGQVVDKILRYFFFFNCVKHEVMIKF